MPLAAGDSACSTGLSHTIYSYLLADGRNGFSGAMTTDQTNAVKALAWGIANAVVGHIQSNAQVNLTITATQGSGNLALVPGGVASSTTSSINWTASGQAFANGLTVPIRASDRTVNLLFNGNATQALLDVTGYFLGK